MLTMQHRPFNTALKRRAIFLTGAINTTSEAVYLPVSKVLIYPTSILLIYQVSGWFLSSPKEQEP
jgi:hypothetical protein